MATHASDPVTVSVTSTPVATVASDPIDLGVASSSLVITLSHPSLGSTTVYTSGAWTAGYSGTVTSDGLGGLDVEISTHPALAVGVWTVGWSVETRGGLLGAGSWPFTVGSPPTASLLDPTDVVTDLRQISLRIEDAFGIDLASLEVTVRDCITRPDDAMVALSGTTWQAGWGGVVAASADLKRVDIYVTTWPSILETSTPRIWVFQASATNIIGLDL